MGQQLPWMVVNSTASGAAAPMIRYGEDLPAMSETSRSSSLTGWFHSAKRIWPTSLWALVPIETVFPFAYSNFVKQKYPASWTLRSWWDSRKEGFQCVASSQQ